LPEGWRKAHGGKPAVPAATLAQLKLELKLGLLASLDGDLASVISLRHAAVSAATVAANCPDGPAARSLLLQHLL
jgi:hypothetical protein